MSFQTDFMALNQDFVSGLDGRTALWNGKTDVPIIAGHRFHETDMMGATFENYDYEFLADLADIDGVKHGDTFVVSDMEDVTLYVTKINFEDDFGMVRVYLSKQT